MGRRFLKTTLAALLALNFCAVPGAHAASKVCEKVLVDPTFIQTQFDRFYDSTSDYALKQAGALGINDQFQSLLGKTVKITTQGNRLGQIVPSEYDADFDSNGS